MMWLEKQDDVLQVIVFVDALLAVSECRMDKVRSGCQLEQTRLGGVGLGQKMVRWFGPGCGSLVVVEALIGTTWYQASSLLMAQ